MTLPEDTILEGRYRIDGLLAYGGRGAIYRAFDTELSTPVAIKENFFETPHQITRFKQEAARLIRLQHPALPGVTHYFSFEGQQYLVMDFVEGDTLWQLVERHGQPLDEGVALNYIIQVCGAVSYLHKQTPPVIHRDIKPRNIKVTPAGQAMLVDFGIGKQITGQSLHIPAEAQGGIPKFSSPEQYGGLEVTPAADIYALGATLYAVLTGQSPPNSVSRLTESEKLAPPDTLNPKLSSQTAQAILQAMQLKPENRPPSVGNWQATLEAIFESTPGSRPAPPKPAAPKTGPKAAPPGPPAQPSSPVPYWLVDSTGMGYPLGPEPLSIGSQPQADVVIDSADVAEVHARLRAEGNRCLVQDAGSPHGTFLNGHRLRSEWYPINPGDVLVIGPARFYLTATRPAKVAPPASKTSPAQAEPAAAPPATAHVDSQPAPVEAPAKSRRVLPLVLAILVILALAGAGGYVWFNGESLGLLPPAVATPQPQAAATGAGVSQPPDPTLSKSQTQTAQAMMAQTIEAATQLTVQARDNAAATRAAAETATAQAQQTPTPDVIPAAQNQSPTPQASASPTPSPSPTATATRRATPIPTGPTLMPLTSRVSIEQIGVQEVIDVDINPKNPREVFALVKKDGIYKSSNGGEGPWQRVDLDGSAITSVVIDPANPARMYASTWNAVLKSTDGGNTWDPKTGGLVANQVVDVVAVHPENPNVLYAGIGETLVVSSDGGETWSSQGYGAGLGLGKVHAIAIDPFNAGTMYVGGLAAAIYKSQDSGQSFIQLPYNTGKGVYSLAGHPTREDVYLAGVNSGAAGIVKTENGFDFASVSTGLLYGGADSAYSAITYAPGSPNIVYAGSGYESNPDAKGIFKSTDGGETWASINNGLSINPDTGYPYYVKSMAVHPARANIVFAATGSGLYQSTDGGENWELR